MSLNKLYKDGVEVNYIIDEALGCVNPQFIIDGHHKAKAYMELNQYPSVMSLVKLQFKNDDGEATHKIEHDIELIVKHLGVKLDYNL